VAQRHRILITVAFLLGLLAPALAMPARAGALLPLVDPALKLHPWLQFGAIVEPDRPVRVIVQKASGLVSKLDILQAAGVADGEAFDFINSVVVEVPQRRVLTLALSPNVLFITPDAPLRRHGAPPDPAALKTTYPVVAGAAATWGDPRLGATGAGVTVAVLDTGLTPHGDLDPRRVQAAVANPAATSPLDPHGHGTHIAGIIAGRSANGAYAGVAPDANVVMVKVGDDAGVAHTTDLLRGLEWVHQHRVARGIRVVSLSVTSSIPESYLTSPVAAAVERLWFDGIVVVAAAGNTGATLDAAWYAPANDPYVITVGCLDDGETAATADDGLCFFSSRGLTLEGRAKPDLVAPGRKVVSTLAAGSGFAAEFPERVVDRSYIRMSGTSMAAPVVAGTVALLLERYPNLTPNQVKWLLAATERTYPGQPDGAGAVDARRAMAAAAGPLSRANRGVIPSLGILTLDQIPLVDGITSLDAASWIAGKWVAGKWVAGKWQESYWQQSYWQAGKWVTAPQD
jgi:serine protease AprX